ncbi:MAG: hypothetical protein U9Q18_01660 [Caldisericota bacterium]|nr:hypothetical protein [Caldisericota bacterium]
MKEINLSMEKGVIFPEERESLNELKGKLAYFKDVEKKCKKECLCEERSDEAIPILTTGYCLKKNCSEYVNRKIMIKFFQKSGKFLPVRYLYI